MTYRDLLIIREMLTKVVVRGEEERVLLEIVDKIDMVLSRSQGQSAA